MLYLRGIHNYLYALTIYFDSQKFTFGTFIYIFFNFSYTLQNQQPPENKPRVHEMS